jgi:hypothetical protein
VATSYSDGFKYPAWPSDGILGLGFPSLSEYHATPLFNTLVTQGVLPTNSFGLCPSELYIGGTNNKLYKGSFTYVPVTVAVRFCIEVPRFGVNDHTFQGFWQTVFDGLYVNGQKISGTTNMIIDSGTSMIMGDTTTVQAFYAQIPGSTLITGKPGYYKSKYGYRTTFSRSQNDQLTFQFPARSTPWSHSRLVASSSRFSLKLLILVPPPLRTQTPALAVLWQTTALVRSSLLHRASASDIGDRLLGSRRRLPAKRIHGVRRRK